MHPSLKGASKIMLIPRITYGLPRFALFVVIIAALIYGPRPAFTQTTDSSVEQAQGRNPLPGRTHHRIRPRKPSNRHPRTPQSAANLFLDVSGYERAPGF